jgi:hypothetical protein
MHLKNETETREAIETWRNASPAVQHSNLGNALKNLELDQMYYEQKGSARGIERCGICLALLKERLNELENS